MPHRRTRATLLSCLIALLCACGADSGMGTTDANTADASDSSVSDAAPPEPVFLAVSASNGIVVYEVKQDQLEIAWSTHDTAGTQVTLLWADMNGDGQRDLVYTAAGVVVVDPRTWQRIGESSGIRCQRLAAYDYDGDGDLDLACANCASGLLYVNNGDARFSQAFLNPEPPCGAFTWGDFDGDDRTDLAANGPAGAENALVIWSYDPATLAFSERFTLSGTSSGTVTGVDLYQDGQHEIVFKFAYDVSGEARTAINAGTLSGNTISWEGLVSLNETVHWTAWADYDGDGAPDLNVVSESQILVYRNEAEFKRLSLVAELANDTGASRSAWGDMDGDGDLDLAIAGSTASRVTVYRNDGGTFVPAIDRQDAINASIQNIAWSSSL